MQYILWSPLAVFNLISVLSWLYALQVGENIVNIHSVCTEINCDLPIDWVADLQILRRGSSLTKC